MSACNGDVIPQRRTFFGDPDERYPKITVEGNIETQQFLIASRLIVILFEKLGKAFTPVKYDVNGNIEKIKKVYDTNTSQNYWLNDMITNEVKNDVPQVTINALLWLKRALSFIQILLQSIIEDAEANTKTENLTPFCWNAYDRTLKPFHSWAVQKISFLCMRAMPGRREIFQILSMGQENVDDLVVTDMRNFVESLNSNLDVVNKLYQDYNLDSNQK
uniref:Glycolipid transfer protein domain-containing protein n=1 Tax=Strigamia maritima TaxID=126957 RepID=T1JMA9_STRMM